MIIYFADRLMNILGHASTELPEGLTVVEDLKTEDVETGVSAFECKIPYTDETREEVEKCAEVGNYILRSNDEEKEFYTIIESESDTKNQEILIYAEDAGLDLLNEVVGAYTADKAYSIEHYILLFANDSGFEIGINEVPNLTRKLSWDGEVTAVERIASVATQFDGCEISYTFEVDGLNVVKKYINIFKQRGKDVGIQLRLNYDIDRIVTTKSITNLATALQVTGGTPESEDGEDVEPITLVGYSYDDGDFYVDNGIVKSRVALQKWSRFIQNGKVSTNKGHIVRQYSYDTLNQETLCKRAITELKKIREMEVNYEIDINKLPDNVKIGDRVNIVDDAGELYVSTRILMLKTSIADDTQTATLGEHLIKNDGISQKVADLAAQFAKTTQSATRALELAKAANENAASAKEQVDAAVKSVEEAQKAVEEVADVVEEAKQSAMNAQTAADNAQAIVDNIEDKIVTLETTVEIAKTAADNAQAAADTAQEKADEAAQAAQDAQADADTAKSNAETALSNSESATSTANAAKILSESARTEALSAYNTANAAKKDADNAVEEVEALGNELESLSNTMTADYARKTELTETTANLQSQITQNAGQIQTTVTKVMEVDETANDAKEKAEKAQTAASQAQEQADTATADAQKAQTAADNAAQAAQNAQADADKAQAAADTAQSVADKAEADLATAKANLATVSSRVDATEADILAAQEAVDTAQAAADKAKADATNAVTKANNAQSVADQAAINATNAQTVATEATEKATLAQQVANEAKGNAETAIATANQAKTTATNAQTVANEAKTNATNAQSVANQAVADAEAAQTAADEADAKAQAAQADLNTAKANLANVSAKADATAEEVEAAQAAVEIAQAAADTAQAKATAAQATADQAKANAQTAQNAADEAQQAADQAQADADAAQAAADKAQAEVDALEVRVTKAETDIIQTSEQIKLLATKEEVTTTLGGYYTKAQTDAAIALESDKIESNVRSTYTTKQEFNDMKIGGRNLILNSKTLVGGNVSGNGVISDETYNDFAVMNHDNTTATSGFVDILHFNGIYPEKLGETYTLSFYAKGSGEFKLRTFFYGTSGYVQIAKSVQSTGTVTTSGDGHTAWTLTEEWKHYWVTWTLASSGDINIEKKILFRLYFGGVANICGVKLEKGNKATDWTPAPEDMATAEDTENAQTTANDALSEANATNERVTLAESLIQQLSDCISMLITDGNGTSLMEQTENGWTFSMAQMNSAMSNLSNSLQNLQNETNDTKSTVSVLESAIADLEETAEYVRIKTYEDEPCIELGESDSNFKLMITNTRIMFLEGDNVPTYINTDGLVTKNLTINGEIHHNNWVWKQRSNGNYGLQWVS